MTDRTSSDTTSGTGDDDPPGPTRCPRCNTPIAMVSSTGPLTHIASPCGCQVSASVLDKGDSR
ncbi:hypothetical protein EA473_20330 [Natrarchaeobius chitinivorans]|uniref:Small CPxCG-related zinc finger protein n=1 Tax=Natrarchaeobius chitinivorans TaxID=1679083 RepID=A0A3N6M5Y0_NATCH|nr:hypothetical protein EA473_20330 [Natrarchaeobius chitinivorans]